MGVSEKIYKYEKEWESRCYPDGVPDEVPYELNELVPSYKKIAILILRNDFTLKGLGFQQPYSQYYDDLKKIELAGRGKVIQLKLF